MPAVPTPLFLLFSIVFAWAWGSVPLGGWLIHRVTGREPRDVTPGLLGVENVFRLLGPPLAAATFLLDVVKGALAVLVFPHAEAAAVGVLAGHVWPIPGARSLHAPRGRGNGVLLGALLALVMDASVPMVAPLVSGAAFGGLLALTGFATLATLAAVGLFALWPGTPALLGLGWLLVVGIRGLPALMRIVDGTEPRLGDPPPVRGLTAGRVRAAFMIHPMTLDDVWQVRSQAWVHTLYRWGWLNEAMLRRFLPWLRPQFHGVLRGVDLPDGRTLEVVLIGGPMLPDQIRSAPEAATKMAIRGAELARELGAEVFGLGAYWSTVGDKGRQVQAEVPEVSVTHGGTYTAATVQAAIPRLLERYQRAGGSLSGATAAVVGANGMVAFGVARLLVPHVGRLILVGTNEERLARSAGTLQRTRPELVIEVATSSDAVRDADLIFAATSEPGYVVRPQQVRPGAWIYDLGRPADVDPAVRAIAGVELIPGGVVRPPGRSQSDLNLHFGDGFVPACLAETMILAATGAHDHAVTGIPARAGDMAWFLEQGERLGFTIVLEDDQTMRAETMQETRVGGEA